MLHADFTGVRCFTDFAVTALHLAGFNLQGALPDVLSALVHLLQLDVSGNPGLTGVLPQQLGAGGRLELLRLDGTSMSCLPTEPGLALECRGSAACADLLAAASQECALPPYITPAGSTLRSSVPRLECDALLLSSPPPAEPDLSAGHPPLVPVRADAYFLYRGCRCSGAVLRIARDAHGGAEAECTRAVLWPHLGLILGAVLCSLAAALAAAFLFLRHRAALRAWRLRWVRRLYLPGTSLMGMPPGCTCVYCEFAGWAQLWALDPPAMQAVVLRYDTLLRRLLRATAGHEGGASRPEEFLAFFHDPIDAVTWCQAVQDALLTLSWPPSLLAHPEFAMVNAKGEVVEAGRRPGGASRPQQLVFRGPRVKMAIHSASPEMLKLSGALQSVGRWWWLPSALCGDPRGVAWYSKQLANDAHDILSIAHSGQVLCGPTTFRYISGRMQQLQEGVEAVRRHHRGKGRASRWLGWAARGWRTCVARCRSGRREPQGEWNEAASERPVRPLPPLKHALTPHLSQHGEYTSQGTGLSELSPSGSSSLMVIDMGRHILPMGSQGYHAMPQQLVQIVGSHVMERANLFGPLPTAQASYSFFDAPCARQGLCHIGEGSALPPVVCVFAAMERCPELIAHNVEAAESLLSMYSTCVRTTLDCTGGYECQELEGTYMVAFDNPQVVFEWAAMLQIVLLQAPWSSSVESLPTTQTVLGKQGQLLFRGVRCKIGLYEDVPQAILPHGSTGRADYFGRVVNRAARIMSAAFGGQVVAVRDLAMRTLAQWQPHQDAESLELLVAFDSVGQTVLVPRSTVAPDLGSPTATQDALAAEERPSTDGVHDLSQARASQISMVSCLKSGADETPSENEGKRPALLDLAGLQLQIPGTGLDTAPSTSAVSAANSLIAVAPASTSTPSLPPGNPPDSRGLPDFLPPPLDCSETASVEPWLSRGAACPLLATTDSGRRETGNAQSEDIPGGEGLGAPPCPEDHSRSSSEYASAGSGVGGSSSLSGSGHTLTPWAAQQEEGPLRRVTAGGAPHQPEQASSASGPLAAVPPTASTGGKFSESDSFDGLLPWEIVPGEVKIGQEPHMLTLHDMSASSWEPDSNTARRTPTLLTPTCPVPREPGAAAGESGPATAGLLRPRWGPPSPVRGPITNSGQGPSHPLMCRNAPGTPPSSAGGQSNSGGSSPHPNREYLSHTLHVHDLGDYAFKGVAGSFEMVQISLGSLLGRLELYPSALRRGKATCIRQGTGYLTSQRIELYNVNLLVDMLCIQERRSSYSATLTD